MDGLQQAKIQGRSEHVCACTCFRAQERTVSKWVEETWTKHPENLVGLGASLVAGLLVVVPAAIAVSSEEWADIASKVATLATAVAVAIVAVVQAIVSYSVYSDHQPAAANTGAASEDQGRHALPSFREGPTVFVNGVAYYAQSYVFRDGNFEPTTLVRRPDGSVTAVGVQRREEVCICRAGSGCLEISKVIVRVGDDLSVRV